MELSLQNLFYPKKIVIIGASSKKGSIGYEITSSIKRYGYTGQLFLVNPASISILDILCYKNVSDIKEELDLAIILVPKAFVEDTIEDALKAGIKSFILITAGFRETGNEGEEAEKRIISKIKIAGARLVGPNCMGVINTLDIIKLNATFVAENPMPGKSAFLSQSGALGAAVLNSLRDTGITFAHFLSVGNKADISENDLLQFWQDDQNIKVMSLYLESFSNGGKFLKLFRDGIITKPVIILKAGKTDAGMKAASSHTGALGSSDRSVTAIFEQFGILRVDNVNDLFNTAKGFESFNTPSGNKIAVVTNAGGPAILAVDQIGLKGLVLSELCQETKEKLRKIVHPEGSVSNPVDLLPGGTAENYRDVVEALVNDKEVDSVIAIFVEPVMVKPIEVVRKIHSIKTFKPVFTVVMPLPEFWDEYKKAYPPLKPLFRNPEDPAVIIRNMLKFKSIRSQEKRLLPQKKLNKFSLTGNGFLSQDQTLILARAYNIPIVEHKILSQDQLKSVESGFPYVIKAGGKEIIHKTELNGVELNVLTRDDLLKSAEKMNCSFNQKNMKIEYFILQPFIISKFEVLVGGFRDPDFGPMVMFGTGGKYVEYYKDIAIRSAYLSEQDIEDIINSTTMGRLLKGVRGEEGVDLRRIKNTISSLARLLLDYDDISEVDINPLLVDKNNNLFTVDMRVKIN